MDMNQISAPQSINDKLFTLSSNGHKWKPKYSLEGSMVSNNMGSLEA